MSIPSLQPADDEPRTLTGVRLVGELPQLRDADAATLILVLADIIEATCVQRAMPVPEQKAEAA